MDPQVSRAVAVIPIRGTLRTKTRLAPLFNADLRTGLVRQMLLRVMGAIERSRVIGHTCIITRDVGVLPADIDLAARCSVLVQDGEGLNAAIELGRDRAIADGYDRMLALLPDLPMLTPEDVRLLIAESAPAVIARDRHETGTNALVLDLNGPAAHMPFTFGSRSAASHIAALERLGLDWSAVDTPGLRHDLDTPDDWDVLPESVQATLLARIGMPSAC